MKFIFPGLAAWAAASAITPAPAQPAAASTADAPFNCALENVAADARALAGAAASQRLTDVPADGEQRGGSALDAIVAALPRCAESGRWTEAQREIAHQYVLFQTAREDVRRRYAAQNVDLTFIDQTIATTTAGSPPPFEEMVARVRAQGVGDNRPDSAGDIVFIYLELGMQAEAMRAAFAEAARARR